MISRPRFRILTLGFLVVFAAVLLSVWRTHARWVESVRRASDLASKADRLIDKAWWASELRSKPIGDMSRQLAYLLEPYRPPQGEADPAAEMVKSFRDKQDSFARAAAALPARGVYDGIAIRRVREELCLTRRYNQNGFELFEKTKSYCKLQSNPHHRRASDRSKIERGFESIFSSSLSDIDKIDGRLVEAEGCLRLRRELLAR